VRHSFLQIAIPVPLRKEFDYRCADCAQVPPVGSRVKVPFGRRQMIGVVVGSSSNSALPEDKLKPISELIDVDPVVSQADLELLRWTAEYYHQPFGEVIKLALPSVVRQGKSISPAKEKIYCLSEQGRQANTEELNRAPLQQHVFAELRAAGTSGRNGQYLQEMSAGWRPALRALQKRGWVEVMEQESTRDNNIRRDQAPQLTPEQDHAVEQILQSRSEFQSFLLYGITGSGKTEVYLHVVEQLMQAGQQALVLVPEIALTPQLVQRFRARLGDAVALIHSGLAEGERHRAWWQASQGLVNVILGTRSAVLTPFKNLGIVIVDEEHDASYKQQDGVRYHARDVAIKRASQLNIPIVLGSATPSLETEENARSGRYRRLSLPSRTAGAVLPAIKLLPMDAMPAKEGLSRVVIDAIKQRLDNSEQSLIFLNRRGYAPLLVCFKCGWRGTCARCDAGLTFHRRSGRLRCHYCGADKPAPETCPECANEKLYQAGEGTQRIEENLQIQFPDAKLLRIDSDTVARKGELERHLQQARDGEADILVGTQILSKGHDFPNVTLVCVLNVDQNLFNVDFRAAEYLFQQVTQVSGRAGRASKPGEVLIQTYYSANPYFGHIRTHDYEGFASLALSERKLAGYPPYTYFVLLRAESTQATAPLLFLKQARRYAHEIMQAQNIEHVQIMDPVPSPMERKAGRYRAQLLIRAPRRQPLHALLNDWIARIENEQIARSVRWSVDVDPTEMY